jgi:hypothetical protein
MSRPKLAPVGVAVLLITAGCAGFVGSKESPRTPYGVPTDRTSEAVEPTTGVVRAPQDVVTVLRDQERQLDALDSYTLQFNRTVEISNESGYFNRVVYRVNRSANRGWSIRRSLRGQQTGLSTFSVYRGLGIFQSRQTPPLGIDARFNSVSDPEMAPRNASIALLGREATTLERVEIRRNGTATVDGESLRRYTAQGSDAFPGQAGNVTSYHLVVLVDDSGLVRVIDERRSRVSASGVEYTTREALHLTDLESTTVGVPLWVERIADTNGTPPEASAGQSRGPDRTVKTFNMVSAVTEDVRSTPGRTGSDGAGPLARTRNLTGGSATTREQAAGTGAPLTNGGPDRP